MPGLMAEEEHRPQGSDAATGDGKPDEAVLRDAPASLAGLPLVYTVQEEGHQVDAHEVYDKNPSHWIVTYHTLPRFIAGYKKNLGRQEVSRAGSQNRQPSPFTESSSLNSNHTPCSGEVGIHIYFQPDIAVWDLISLFTNSRIPTTFCG